MKKPKFSLAHKYKEMLELVGRAEYKILAVWAIDCALCVPLFFEKKYPEDWHPQQALKTLREWIDMSIFKMKIVRKASLDSHAVARETGENSPAQLHVLAVRPWWRLMFRSILMVLRSMHNRLFSGHQVFLMPLLAASEVRDWQYWICWI